MTRSQSHGNLGPSGDRRTPARIARPGRRCLASLLLALCLPARAAVDEPGVFADMTLEELANVRITSVSKKPEPLADAPASVFVITGEEIRRAGATTLPEALRLAPNLQVARLDARNYAISARGFNNAFANKLLVLIDGRTVYSPLFSGVFWDAQDVMLEDVQRIEVISGPGATLWGGNAVNGVINVITRPAGDTRGALAAVGASRLERQAVVRQGGKTAHDAAYRVYAKHMDADDTARADGQSTRTGWRRSQAGFRSDWSERGRSLTLQGDAYDGSLRQAGTSDIGISGGNLTARMNESLADGSDLSLLAYWDYTHRNQPGAFVENLHTLNFDLQHTLTAAANHTLVWGAGYRLARDRLTNGAAFAFLPGATDLHWGSLFVQDDVALSRDVRLTGGVRFEHNNYTGFEVLPTLRLAWRPARSGTMWGSLSRAARVPSRIDRDFYSPSQPVPVNGALRYAIAGGSEFASEIARVLELGYRGQPSPAVSYSVTVFHADYDRLRTLERNPDGFSSSFANRARGRSRGIESWGTLQAWPGGRLSAGLVVQRVRSMLEPGSTDVSGMTGLAHNDPSHYWMLRASHELAPGKELDLTLRRVGALRQPRIPSYTDLSLRLGWKLRRDLELSLIGQNLLDASHPEFGSPANRSEIERAVFVKLLWRPE